MERNNKGFVGGGSGLADMFIGGTGGLFGIPFSSCVFQVAIWWGGPAEKEWLPKATVGGFADGCWLRGGVFIFGTFPIQYNYSPKYAKE